MTYYIFVTGGVCSGLGKGVTTASIGKILQSKGYKISAIKIDPYVNCDAGTMNPIQHGEVFVTEDGGETDQDIGNYERFLDISLPKYHNITSGQVYGKVIDRERMGDYLGRCVETLPHVSREVIRRIEECAKNSGADIVITEIGGTVGEYQNEIFYRAARQMKTEGENVLFAHVSYFPILKSLGEMKTKPTQQSAELLGSLSIQPDFIIGRAERPLDEIRKEKVSTFCYVKKEDVISNPDVESIYEVPLKLEEQDLGNKILKKFKLKPKKSDLKEWRKFVEHVKGLDQKVKVGIIGKYFNSGDFKLSDSYISVIEATKHAAWHNDRIPNLDWIDSETFEKNQELLHDLDSYDGIIVPGGFGARATEGKILAIQYARENNIPYLGLCLGLQLAVVEFARNVCNLKGADSTEFNAETPYPVIDLMPKQIGLKYKGATMRMGEQTAFLKKGTKVWEVYGRKREISERHRHRYEVNPKYHEILQKNGLVFSGMSPDGKLVEFIELQNHLYFTGTQAHPEFKSRPLKPAPLFDGLIKACIK